MRTFFFRQVFYRKMFYRAVLTLLLVFTGLSAQAAKWVLDPGESHVFFKYSYKGTPYQGEFTNVEATFKIDPKSPGSCNFSVTIPIGDLSIENPEVKDYLLDIDLFDVDQWPTASFKAEKCRLESANSFVSDGTLTIRDQTHPMSFPFNLEVEIYDGQVRFHLTSEVTIPRLQYGVGQGYFANTAEIPNDVIVDVDVYAAQQ